jgi:uncharacterized protein DUF4126
MDLTTLGFAVGSAWLSGINLYATVFMLGLLQRFNMAHLPGDMSYVAHTWVLVLSGVLFAVQFIADKIPAVDSAWDMVHTFIRVPAGAILAAAAFAHFDPSVRLAAMLLGGGVALSSHGAKTASRLAANTSPEPFSNAALSLAGDAVTVGGTVLMVHHPIVILVCVVIAMIVSILMIRMIWKFMRRLFSGRSNPRSSVASA